MWTYLAYILDRYSEVTGKDRVKVADIYNFHGNYLWMGEHLTFWEGMGDLNADIAYLEKLGLATHFLDMIEFTNPKGLASVASIAGAPNIKLFNEYKRRIDKAMKIWLEVEPQ